MNLKTFLTPNSGPQALPKATFEQLKNEYKTHQYPFQCDSARLLKTNTQQYGTRVRFEPEVSDWLDDFVKKINPGGRGGLSVQCYDPTRNSYYNSTTLIKEPKFYLAFDRYANDLKPVLDNFEITEVCLVEAPKEQYQRYSGRTVAWLFKVLCNGEEFCFVCNLEQTNMFPSFKIDKTGLVTVDKARTQFTISEFFDYLVKSSPYLSGQWSGTPKVFPLNYIGVSCLYSSGVIDKETLCDLMVKTVANPPRTGFTEETSMGVGISKVLSKNVMPYLDELKREHTAHYCILRSLITDTRRTLDSVKLSTVFNIVFEGVKDIEDLKSRIWPDHWELPKNQSYYRDGVIADDWYRAQECYKEQRKKALKSQSGRAITKVMEEVESLNLDESLYPKTFKAVTEGELPLGTFFRKSEQYFVFNDNWALWEEMLAKYPIEAKEIAASAAPRTTYEKDLMSYFYFVLHALPEYLQAQTGEEWTCSPKLVNSQDELEPPKEEGGVSRKRSALTPIVDNDKKTVVVPYASLAVSGGYGTTYCYSLDYQVLKKGFSFMGNVVMSDVENKLNGRDDYGLMFYTLTGSAQGRGYPTFLIIFERRKKGTHVHFHRTHPSRSKDGDYNPIHNWTRVCYNWMIGNVAKENIVAQQGDLAFIKMEDSGKMEFKEIVKAYDNHVFASTVYFEPNESKTKSNILGYVKVSEDNVLQHHEHEWVTIPAGTYQVRQCRSWEANPKGVWSLRID